MHFVCTPERDAVLRGYGCRFTLFLLVKGAVCVAAYAPKHSQWMEPMKAYLPETLIAELNRRNTLEKMQLMLFSGEKMHQYGAAKVLRQADYPFLKRFSKPSIRQARRMDGCANTLWRRHPKDTLPDTVPADGCCQSATRRICPIWRMRFSIREYGPCRRHEGRAMPGIPQPWQHIRCWSMAFAPNGNAMPGM